MIDAIGSVLPPQLRDKLAPPPQAPPTQFQVIQSVPQMDIARQRAVSILSRIQKSEEKKSPSTEDQPEVEEYRGGSVDIIT